VHGPSKAPPSPWSPVSKDISISTFPDTVTSVNVRSATSDQILSARTKKYLIKD
jgi:hypothetical protein